MKTCTSCNVSKPLSEFNKKGKYLQRYCRDCQKEYHKKWYSNNKKSVRKRCYRNAKRYKQEVIAYVAELLSNSECELCGNKDFYCLEFDHLRDKKKDVGSLMHTTTLRIVKEEIAKCRILCANCHKKETHIAANTWRHQYMVSPKGI